MINNDTVGSPLVPRPAGVHHVPSVCRDQPAPPPAPLSRIATSLLTQRFHTQGWKMKRKGDSSRYNTEREVIIVTVDERVRLIIIKIWNYRYIFCGHVIVWLIVIIVAWCDVTSCAPSTMLLPSEYKYLHLRICQYITMSNCVIVWVGVCRFLLYIDSMSLPFPCHCIIFGGIAFC